MSRADISFSEVMSVKKLTRVLAFLLVLITLCSCGRESKIFFDKDFEASVCYTRLGKEFSAVYTKADGCEALRFLSPETLVGVSATRENGMVTVSYDGLSFTSVSDIFAPFNLFSECTAKKSGEECFVTEDGVTILTSGGFPKEVSGEEFNLKITEYKISERSGTSE